MKHNKNLNRLFRKIDGCDIVSFDIFDTLLVRNTNSPNTIFQIIEKTICKADGSFYAGFADNRIKAGKRAAEIGENGEATLKEIYDLMTSYTLKERSELMSAELMCEKKYLQANKNILPIYNYCCKKNKRIIITSDMYLPSEFLKQLIIEKGFDCEELFVSCELKTNKHIGGIFKKIEDKLSCKGNKIIHIGDNLRNDYLMPIKSGWKAFHFDNKPASSNCISIEEEVVSSYARNNKPSEFYTRIGFTKLGPLLWNFCFWLDECIKKQKNDTVLFLSRDGKIMLKAYQTLFNDSCKQKCHYFYASRRTLNTCMLWKHSSFKELKKYITVTKTFTLSSFIKRIGLNPSDYEDKLKSVNLNILKEYEEPEFWNDKQIIEFYNNIENDVVENSKNQYDLLKRYLLSMNVEGNVGIVDIGWRGSMQKRLQELFTDESFSSVNSVNGYYFGIENNESNMFGFLYKGNKNENKITIDAGFGLFEMLFLAHEGTTLAYSGDNKIFPILDEYEIQNNEMKENLDRIHDGALLYLEELKKLGCMALHDREKMNPYVFEEIKRLILYPCKEEICKLGKIPFNDTVNTTIIRRKGIWYYLLHLKKFKQDYHTAAWKIGFLKENVSSLFPWGSLYWKLKKL